MSFLYPSRRPKTQQCPRCSISTDLESHFYGHHPSSRFFSCRLAISSLLNPGYFCDWYRPRPSNASIRIFTCWGVRWQADACRQKLLTNLQIVSFPKSKKRKKDQGLQNYFPIHKMTLSN